MRLDWRQELPAGTMVFQLRVEPADLEAAPLTLRQHLALAAGPRSSITDTPIADTLLALQAVARSLEQNPRGGPPGARHGVPTVQDGETPAGPDRGRDGAANAPTVEGGS